MNDTIKPDSLLIRAVGNWNPKIFTPIWIKKNLTEPESIETLDFLFDPQEIEIGYDIQGIKIFPKPSELAITIEGKDDINSDKIMLCNKILIKILQLLPQTPIKAIGFNINYAIGVEQNTKITDWYKKQTQNYEDLSLNQVIVNRDFGKYILNIVVNSEADKYKINFNYHFTSIDENPNLYIDLINDTGRYL